MPHILHNMYEGTLVVRATMGPGGTVTAAELVSMDFEPVGRGLGKRGPIGYADAALKATKRLRYAPSGIACVRLVPFVIRWTDG